VQFNLLKEDYSPEIELKSYKRCFLEGGLTIMLRVIAKYIMRTFNFSVIFLLNADLYEHFAAYCEVS
jgi:hypothetical protein